jgi:hypothetical protein
LLRRHCLELDGSFCQVGDKFLRYEGLPFLLLTTAKKQTKQLGFPVHGRFTTRNCIDH